MRGILLDGHDENILEVSGSHFQLWCAPTLLIPLPRGDWESARGEFALIPDCEVLASPLRQATSPGAESVQVGVQKSKG